ncbi:MAG: OprO/OprP family phosphate-selective porin [Holophagales bacterium]|jgi:phosphate-selective porin|nr:OprO/OprP family phosphate-selective porin [Holophagales bacterium]
MFNLKNTSLVSLLLVAGLPAAAQTPKITGLVQVWYTQMMDNNLRLNSNTGPYDIRGEFRENGFAVRRTEIKLAGNVGDNVDWEVMFDPTITSLPILQDVSAKYKLPGKIEIKVGQFKNLQTLEGMTSSSELMLIERSQMAKRFGDVRDRGAVASIGFGDSKAINGRLHVGLFNANAKNNDNNAQKDMVARLEMGYGKLHSFGAYTLQGSTNLTDTGSLTGGNFNGSGAPTPEEVLDNKDKTNQMGAYYRFQDDKIHASFEFITGTIGRLYPSLGSINTNRKHMDQSFMGYVGTLGYTFGSHSLIARYDNLNYNSGDKWYGDTNPYVSTAAGTDYTPNYSEITLGYTYAFMPDKIKNANIKVNYVMRSKNFLTPRASAGQKGEQGGDTLYVCFQTSF